MFCVCTQYVVCQREKGLGSLPAMQTTCKTIVVSLSNEYSDYSSFVSFIYRLNFMISIFPHFSRSWVLTIGIRAILVFTRNGHDWLKTYMKFVLCLDKNFSDSQPENFYDEFYLFLMVDSILKKNRLLPLFIYFLLFLPDHIRKFCYWR